MHGARYRFLASYRSAVYDQTEESAPITTAITLQDITIYQVVEQQGPFFDVMEFFPTLTKELLEVNRPWLQPTFVDPVSGRLVLCVQSFIIKTPHHNILIDLASAITSRGRRGHSGT